MKGVVGIRTFKKNIGMPGSNLYDWFSVSDEAWILLMLENYEDRWTKMISEDILPTTHVGDDGGKWTGRDVRGSSLGGGML